MIPAQQKTAAQPALKPARLQSLDLLRGFTIAAMILVNTPGDGDHVYHPLTHSEWNGCTPTDVIFPGFIFMAGVSIVFALGSKRHAPGVLLKALRRMLTLIAIGWGINLVYHFDLAHLRFPGVLQRIALVYFIATFLFIKLDLKQLRMVSWVLLVGYYLLFWLPFPGKGADLFDPQQNIVAYVDHVLFGADHLYKWAYTDPCGLLGTLPAVVTALLGIEAGYLLKQEGGAAEKTSGLMVMGMLLVAAGLLADFIFPINKPLWSSAYVLYTGGICMCCLGISYWYFDVKQHGSRFWPLLVFGTNAIFAYVVAEVLPRFMNMVVIGHARGLHIVYAVLAQGIAPELASLLTAMLFVVVVWGIMLILYKRGIVIKV